MFGTIPAPVRHREHAVSEPWFVPESGACQCASDVSRLRVKRGDSRRPLQFQTSNFFCSFRVLLTESANLDGSGNTDYDVRYEFFKQIEQSLLGVR
jgi:hypothetical protein